METEKKEENFPLLINLPPSIKESLSFEAKNFVIYLDIQQSKIGCRLCGKEIKEALPIFCPVERCFFHFDCIRKKKNHLKRFIPHNSRHEDYPVLIKWKNIV